MLSCHQLCALLRQFSTFDCPKWFEFRMKNGISQRKLGRNTSHRQVRYLNQLQLRG